MNAKPIFEWAFQHGETKIIERILVRLLPDLIDEKVQVTAESLLTMPALNVSEELYKKIQLVAEEMVGQAYQA